MNYDKGYNVYYNFTDKSEVPDIQQLSDFYKVAMPITSEYGPVNVLTYVEDLATLNNLYGTYKSNYVDYSLKIAEDIVSNGGKLIVYRIVDENNGYKAQRYFINKSGELSFTNYEFTNTTPTSSYQAGDNVFTEGAGDYDISGANSATMLSEITAAAEPGSIVTEGTYVDDNEFLFTVRSFYPSTYNPFSVRISPISNTDIEDIYNNNNLTRQDIKELFIKIEVVEIDSSRVYESYTGTLQTVVDSNGVDQKLSETINSSSDYIFINFYNESPLNLRSYVNKLNLDGSSIINEFDNEVEVEKTAYFTSEINGDITAMTSAEGSIPVNINTLFTSTDFTDKDTEISSKVPILNVDYSYKIDMTNALDNVVASTTALTVNISNPADILYVTDMSYSKFTDDRTNEITGFSSTLSKGSMFQVEVESEYVNVVNGNALVLTYTDTITNSSTVAGVMNNTTPVVTYAGKLVTGYKIRLEEVTFGDFILEKGYIDLGGTAVDYSTTIDVDLDTVETADMTITDIDLYQIKETLALLPTTTTVEDLWNSDFSYSFDNPIDVYDRYNTVKLLGEASTLNLINDNNIDYFILCDMVVKEGIYEHATDATKNLSGKDIWTELQSNLNAITTKRKDSLGFNFTRNFTNDDVEDVNTEFEINGELDPNSLIVLDTLDSNFITYYGGWGKETIYGGETIPKPLLGEQVGKIMNAVESNPAFIPAGIDNFGVNAASKTLTQKVPDTRWGLFDNLRVNIPVTIKGYGNYMWFKNTTYRKNSDLKEVNNMFALVYLIKSFYPTLIRYIHKPYTDTLTGTNYVSNMVNDLYVIIDSVIQAFAERPVISVVSTAADLDNGIIKLKTTMKFSKTIKYIDVEFVFEKSGEYYTNII